MNNSEPVIRLALRVSIISGTVGFINGVFIILAGTSYFYVLSPYSLILGALFLVFPGQVVDGAENFLFRSGVQFVLAPLLGAFLGAWIGSTASRSRGRSARPLLVKTGAASAGIGGFLSLDIIFLNIYAS
jgi:hypothetical protein